MMLEIERRDFGDTGLKVSALGYGAGHIGSPAVEDRTVETLLNAVVDAGINLIDTARGYGLSEERIGRFLGHRRKEVVLSTKVGYGVEGVPDWTGEAVSRGVDEALVRLRTDVIDIVHLHSCAPEVLGRGEVLAALERARAAGKIRVAAYSGDNEPLEAAVSAGRSGSIQTSINPFDQRVLRATLPAAKARGMGVIAKRPLGNAPWRFAERPVGHYAEAYWQRMRAMGLDFGAEWADVALRFVVFRYGVDSAIVGTSDRRHLEDNIRIVNRGRLDDERRALLEGRFAAADQGWTGQV